jgi:anaerobic ribonucleoside-triphosphate reductase
MENEKRIARVDEQISQVEQKLKDPKLCEGTADTYTRVSGYYRNVDAFNDGKRAETVERREYSLA